MGLWDGQNGTHGRIYDCHNMNCIRKFSIVKSIQKQEEEKEENIKINESNMIFVDLIKSKRKELQITISKMAKGLGISPSDYSDYEQCREPLPIETLDKINLIFREAFKNG